MSYFYNNRTTPGTGYGMPSVDDLQFGPAPAANADRSASTLDTFSLGVGAGIGNGPEAFSFSEDYAAGGGSNSGQSSWMDNGIGSIRPPGQSLIDGSRDAGGGLPDWMNWDNAENIMKGVGMLGSIYFGIQKNKLAKEALAYKKKAYSENMDFQKQSYNTALEDRIRSRASFTGQGDGYVSKYLDKNRL